VADAPACINQGHAVVVVSNCATTEVEVASWAGMVA
jgi:hypothetical protein